MDAANAYERGFCRDCEAKIKPYGASSRCQECTDKFESYVASNWGLDEVIKERSKNELLGLCFHCGAGLEKSDKRLCLNCEQNSGQGRWCKDMVRKGGKPVEENPYNSAWDSNEVDNSTYLTPTLGTMADRMFVKARHFRVKAERGGPRGREYEQEAAIYQRIAERLQASFLEVGKYK